MGGTCPDDDLGAAVPVVDSGSTSSHQDTAMGSCGGLASPDVTSTFTAPATGFYRFETAGSSFDTALYLRDAACDGPELACNGDVSSSDATSGVSAQLFAGQTVVVVVDGNADDGAYVLTVDAASCPAQDLGSLLPVAQAGSTVGETNLLDGPCGGFGAPETTFAWTVPHDGTFVFDTTGSSFDTKLYLLDGPTCDAAVIACDDDGGFGSQSRIVTDLVGGQPVVVVVDGADESAGDYALTITEQILMCPDADLGSALPLTHMGNTTGEPNEVDGSCTGGAGPDVGLTWTAPSNGMFVLDTFGSAFDTVLTVYDGATCSGTELACNDDEGGAQSEVTLALSAGQTITIVVDGYGGAASGDFVLHIDGP
jgi:hypothetical protein